MTSEATIRGAGIYGLTLAWELLSRGWQVTVIDPAGPGAGASGNLVGALAPHVPENWTPLKALQYECLVAAEPFWAEIEGMGQSPGYARTGRLQPLADADAEERALARATSAATLWPDHRWQAIDAPEGWTPLSPTGRVIFDTLTARVDAPRAIAALAHAIQMRGGAIETDAPERGAVIHATGAAGLDDLSAAMGKTAGKAIKGQAARLAYDAKDLPQIYADGLHIVPHADGTVGIGSTTERDYDDLSTDTQLDDVITRVRIAVPALKDAPVTARWAGLRPRAKSRAPVIDLWPDRPGHYVLNGGFKIGFGTHIPAARLMADLIETGHADIPDACRL
ncbi:bifunctional tRNA (mnm(5)s(2)U34)-methyltransferase/FAD-dependent cmnm(5)s(2)U34 oxidoreductase [Rhodobacteraceae bacterium THAF1]|uniref:NAD(P)/FAD-dependent oxidoreductase n=1 Tax=Palleronia sp. THAF1 TaxID=2587842 RepID=UPI000F3D31CB|nr:FAD-dependent oxidoreductase [Palleronia sp. THAF1]QFU09634.1 bifunctional tRNA (mnm(5)s(2)U34)-methyltransferase/FAD-dependent cmnm(5)s(2)U34 oxidoreductase [Palleronia sp. THAF1]VDC17465.1 bifunctional tRNA (mnm(5)s(2)U34)-methyltransferase/FAD-dependent cmnm(5)s(2)U34 oxidoreductase [Rhodobacteraceae bacterium THAF1]